MTRFGLDLLREERPDEEKIAELMASETWLTGVEALALGYAISHSGREDRGQGDLRRFTNLRRS